MSNKKIVGLIMVLSPFASWAGVVIARHGGVPPVVAAVFTAFAVLSLISFGLALIFDKT